MENPKGKGNKILNFDILIFVTRVLFSYKVSLSMILLY